jgi:hypothetical protein
LQFSLLLAVGAVACAYACIVVCATIKNFWLIIVLVWFVLLFGGGIVPGATGTADEQREVYMT